jgi:hypothetical protein
LGHFPTRIVDKANWIGKALVFTRVVLPQV